MPEQASHPSQTTPLGDSGAGSVASKPIAVPVRTKAILHLTAREPLKRTIERIWCRAATNFRYYDLIANDLLRTIPWIRLQIPGPADPAVEYGNCSPDPLD